MYLIEKINQILENRKKNIIKMFKNQNKLNLRKKKYLMCFR